MPECTRNALQPERARRAPARPARPRCRGRRRPRSPTSTKQLARGGAQLLLRAPARVVVTGRQLSGMSTSVVTPPAAAARVAVSKPSQSVRPGSLMWTWQSTRPGATTQIADVVDAGALGGAASPASTTARCARRRSARSRARRRPAARRAGCAAPSGRCTPAPRHQNSASREAAQALEVRVAILDEERARDAADQARDRVLHARDAGAAEAQARAGRRTCSCRGSADTAPRPACAR